MRTDEIRESFLRFFEERDHRRVPSAPLVPPGDPTLLFTSAGMVQFKPYFMGQTKPPHPRLTSVQKCFRTSDIDSVGDTSHLTFFEMLGNFSVGEADRSADPRPYFKAEAIAWAWEFVTDKKWLGLDPDRLWATVYLDDEEAFDLWRWFLPPERIRRYGEEHNYWFSGTMPVFERDDKTGQDVYKGEKYYGPGGPCSELHYDFGPEFGCGPACGPNHDGCDRFLEIWNLVFMSYFCDGDKRDPLPSKNIDTGAGLDRIAVASLFESKEWKDKSKLPSVYDTDLFAPIIKRIEELSGKKYGKDPSTSSPSGASESAKRTGQAMATDRGMRIVADHARAVTFLIGDERTPVIPSNEGRGYAARRVLRRAVYFGAVLGRGIVETKVWEDKGLYHVLDIHSRRVGLAQIVPEIIAQMGSTYPELVNRRDFIERTVSTEEETFYRTLTSGEQLVREMLVFRDGTTDLAENAKEPRQEFKTYIAHLDLGKVVEEITLPLVKSQIDLGEVPPRVLTASEAFLLHDTYGFPIELTVEIARERGFSVDEAGFEVEMEKQRERARAATKGAESVAAAQVYAALGDIETGFSGYETLETESSVVALLGGVGAQGLAPLQTANADSEVELFLAETPFYPEGGGQVGDRGEIVTPSGRVAVEDTQTVAERLIVHRGRVVEGRIAVGDTVSARVDARHRQDTMRNHTGTHLLHAALRKVLGAHVRQSGSLVAPDHLRFDFTHTEPLTEEQIAEVQRLVNDKIRQDLPVETRQTGYDQAMSEGVLAFFGEKYGEEVRVVEVNSVAPRPALSSAERFSAELCGGTHCRRTGEIGVFIITGESSIGAGMRRIEALTGRGAEDYVRTQAATLDEIARRLGAPREAVPTKLEALLAELDAERKKVERLERSLASGATARARRPAKPKTVNGVSVSVVEVEATSDQALRYIGDSAKRELEGAATAVYGAVIDGKPAFIAVVSEGAIARGLTADALVREIARVAGGGGGGRPDMATGGGKDPAKLAYALKQVPDIVRKLLAGT